MAKPKNPNAYPLAYHDILSAIENDKTKQFRLPCADEKDARAAQFDFLMFKRAVQNFPNLLRLYREIDSVRTRKEVNENGELFVVIYHIEDSSLAKRWNAVVEPEMKKLRGETE